MRKHVKSNNFKQLKKTKKNKQTTKKTPNKPKQGCKKQTRGNNIGFAV